MLKINPSARLPLKTFVDKGSYQQRIEYAKKLNEKFSTILQERMLKGQIEPYEYKKILEDILPENIRIIFKTYIRKFLGQDNAYVSVSTNTYDEADKMEIQIPCRKLPDGSKVVDNIDSSIFMHENFHLFALLANPKHVARVTLSEKEGRFYENYIYTNMHSKFGIKERYKWKKGFKDFLGRKNLESQINFLQNCRYRLLEEKLAYAEGDKYGNPNSMNKFFYFEEKIKIIEKLLYKTLKKARKENKKAFF